MKTLAQLKAEADQMKAKARDCEVQYKEALKQGRANFSKVAHDFLVALVDDGTTPHHLRAKAFKILASANIRSELQDEFAVPQFVFFEGRAWEVTCWQPPVYRLKDGTLRVTAHIHVCRPLPNIGTVVAKIDGWPVGMAVKEYHGARVTLSNGTLEAHVLAKDLL